MRACWALLLLMAAAPASAHADENETHGGCSPIVRADNGARVVINCAEQTRKQLATAESERQRLERGVADTRAQLEQLRTGVTKLHDDMQALREQRAEPNRIDRLHDEIADQESALMHKQTELEIQQAQLDGAERYRVALEQKLAAYAAQLRALEADRVTPDALHWVGFATAAVGFGTALVVGIETQETRHELEAELRRARPTMSEAESKAAASRVRTGNAITVIALVVGAAGLALGAMYFKDLAQGETPGLQAWNVELGRSELQVSYRGPL